MAYKLTKKELETLGMRFLRDPGRFAGTGITHGLEECGKA